LNAVSTFDFISEVTAEKYKQKLAKNGHHWLCNGTLCCMQCEGRYLCWINMKFRVIFLSTKWSKPSALFLGQWWPYC